MKRNKKLQTRILNARERGQKVRDLENELGLTRGYLSRVQWGYAGLKDSNWKKLAALLECDVATILPGRRVRV